MKLIEPSVEIMSPIPEDVLQVIERAGRTCYRSEEKITPTSANGFVANLIKRQHESVLEHASLTVRFITDRGILAELTRHRLNSFSVESSRFCNYKDKELEFTNPGFINDPKSGFRALDEYEATLKTCEAAYKRLISANALPQDARAVLPLALRTEIVTTANLRQWRLVFKQRCAKAAHPQMRQIMVPLLKYLQGKIPVIFDDIVAVAPELPLAIVTESK